MSPSTRMVMCLCQRWVRLAGEVYPSGEGSFEGRCGECHRQLKLDGDDGCSTSAEPASPLPDAARGTEVELPFVPDQVRFVKIEVGDESSVPLDGLFPKPPAGGAA